LRGLGDAILGAAAQGSACATSTSALATFIGSGAVEAGCKAVIGQRLKLSGIRLGGAERWHLYRLAEALPLRSWDGTAVVPDAVVDVLRPLDSLPAVLINGRLPRTRWKRG